MSKIEKTNKKHNEYLFKFRLLKHLISGEYYHLINL